MIRMFRPMIGVTVLLWVLLGFVFPLAMTGISNLVMPNQAQGSPVYLNGVLVGAAHVGQNFQPNLSYFWGRPSATVSVATGKPKPYDAFNSSPSNTGPTNQQLITDIKQRVAWLIKTTPGLKTGQIPIDLVESSGSGLDPDISVQGALIQIPRVANYTHLSEGFLRGLVQDNVVGPSLGLFGPSRVNVLELNLALYKALHG